MAEKICIAGSRACLNVDMVQRLILRLANEAYKKGALLPVIVHGGAAGVDTIADVHAEKAGMVRVVFRPAWNGPARKGAGFQRNILMAEYADRLIAIWNGSSTGTKHCIAEFEKRGKPVQVKRTGGVEVYYRENYNA